MSAKAKSAIAAIQKHGILLVYPINNRKEPRALWHELYPRSEMRWEWDDSGDDRVASLWRMREQLSSSRKVVYAKWYQGRATFFSREVFVALVSILGSSREPSAGLSPQAREILAVLESDSPLSTKQVKAMTNLRGKANEAAYTRALKQLWSRLLIVGFGELDDGAFPSLLMGASRVLFEELWEASLGLSPLEAERILDRFLPPESLFWRQLRTIQKGLKGKPTSSGALYIPRDLRET